MNISKDLNHIPDADVQCFFCAHLNIENSLVCEAFPEGIPKEIRNGEIRHDKPIKDQNNNIIYKLNTNFGLE